MKKLEKNENMNMFRINIGNGNILKAITGVQKYNDTLADRNKVEH